MQGYVLGMGFISRISEVARNSEIFNMKREGQKSEYKPPEDTADQKPSKMNVIDKISEPAEKKKVLKQKLKEKNQVSILRESTGIEGGISTDSKMQKTVQPEITNAGVGEKSNPTTLINTGTGAIEQKKESSLQGGIENKISADDINSGRVKTIVQSFSVQGGLGADIADDSVTKTNYLNTPSKEEKGVPLKMETSASNEVIKKVPKKVTDTKTKSPADTKNKLESIDPMKSNPEKTKDNLLNTTNSSQPPNNTKPLNIQSSAAPAIAVSPSAAPTAPNDNSSQENNHKKYLISPESKDNSYLSQDRKDGKILYETSAFKRRYFLQFFWTERHFTLSQGGILKYYRNLNGKRRGEFDIQKDFISFSPYDAKKGSHRYRINIISEKEDDIGFDSAEKRDEFLYWMRRSCEKQK